MKKSSCNAYREVLNKIHLEEESFDDQMIDEQAPNHESEELEEDETSEEIVDESHTTKVNSNTTQYRELLQSVICFKLPKAGDKNIFGAKITGNSSHKAKSARRGEYRFIGSLKVLTGLTKEYLNKDRPLYTTQEIQVPHKDSSVIKRVQVTSKSVNITLKDLVLKLVEKGKIK